MIVDGSAKNLLAHGVYFAAMSTSWIRTFTVPDCPRDCSACDEFTNANDGSSSHTACVGASGRCWSSPLFRSRACAIRRTHMPNVASDQRRHPQWDIQHGIQRRRYAPMRDHAVRTGGGGPAAVCAHGEVWVGVQVPRWSLPPRIALCRPMTHALEVFCGRLRAPLMFALRSTRVARLWLPVRASCMPRRVRTSPASCWRSQQRLLVARRAQCL